MLATFRNCFGKVSEIIQLVILWSGSKMSYAFGKHIAGRSEDDIYPFFSVTYRQKQGIFYSPRQYCVFCMTCRLFST